MSFFDSLTQADEDLQSNRRLPGVRLIVPAPWGSAAAYGRLDSQFIFGDDQWNLASGEAKTSSQDRIRAAAWLESGGWAVAAGTRIWRLSNGGEIAWSVRSRNTWGFLINTPSALCLAPEGIVVSQEAGALELFSPEGQLIRQRADASAPHFLASLSSGELIGADGRTTSRWDPDTLQPLQRRSIEPHIYSGALSAGGALMLRVSGGVLTLDQSLQVTAHVLLPNACAPFAAPSPCGQKAIVGLAEGWAILSMATGAMDCRSAPSRVLSAAWSPGGDRAWIGLEDGSVLCESV